MDNNNVLTVDTFQIGVPGGDCAIHLLIKNAPLSQAVGHQNDEAAVSQVRSGNPINANGRHGMVMKAVLVDGGHDGRPNYFGSEAAKKIKKTITDIENSYILPDLNGDYPNEAPLIREQLRFDSWIITHWDRDHYCGSLYMIWEDLHNEVQTDHFKRRSKYMKYSGVDCLTTLYCPTWGYNDVKGAKGHHHLFDARVVDNVRYAFIWLPKVIPDDGPLVSSDKGYVDSNYLCRVVHGWENLVGRDIFSGVLYDETVARISISNDHTLGSVGRKFREKMGDATFRPSYMKGLNAMASTPILLCVGAMGNVLGSGSVEPQGATADNFISIITILIWLPFADETPRVSLYMGGDAYCKTEDLLINFLQGAPIEVMKASHHGARSSTSANFLSVCKPNKFIISAGKEHGHPSWQLVALLYAYFASKKHDVEFQFKNKGGGFCHTTRFPYYFYLSHNPNKSPSSRQVNIKSYLGFRDKYTDAFNIAAGRTPTTEEDNAAQVEAEAFWTYKTYAQISNVEDKLSWRLYYFKEYSHMAHMLYQFFYPHIVDGSTAQDKDTARALILLMRKYFSAMTSYKPDYNKSQIFDLTYVRITSSNILEYDGITFRRENYSEYVRRTLGGANRPEAAYSRKIKAVEPVGIMSKKISKQQFLPHRKEKPYTFKVLPYTGDEHEDVMLIREALENTGETNEDKDGNFREFDSFENGVVILVEPYDGDTEDVIGEIFNAAHQAPAHNDQTHNNHDGNINFDTWNLDVEGSGAMTTTAEDHFAFESDDTVNSAIGSVDAGSMIGGVYYSMAGASMSMLTLPTQGLARETAMTINGLHISALAQGIEDIAITPTAHGIRCNELTELVDPSANNDISLFIAAAPESPTDAMMTLIPTHSLTFDIPVSVSESPATFEATLLSSSFFMTLMQALFNSSSSAASQNTKPTSLISRITVTGTISFQEARIDKVNVYLILETQELCFSTAPEAIANQFGVLDLINTKNGIQLRPGNLILALEPPPPEVTNDTMTLTSVFLAAGAQVPLWVTLAIGSKEVEILFKSTSKGDDRMNSSSRNGIWLLPTDDFSTVLRIQYRFKEANPLAALFDNRIESLKDIAFTITAKKTCAWSPEDNGDKNGSASSIDTRPLLVLSAEISLAGKSEADVVAYITLSKTDVTLDLVRRTEAGSLEELFDWLATLAGEFASALGSSLKEIRDTIENTKGAGQKTKEDQPIKPSTASADVFWRQVSITFQGQKKAITRVEAVFEIELAVGVAEEEMAGFALSLEWTPCYWQVCGSFLPKTDEEVTAVLKENLRLDPTFEMRDYVPPLRNKNRAKVMNLLYLDPAGTLKPEDVPRYLPTDIAAAELVVSSDGLEFTALLKSQSAPTGLSQIEQGGSEVPMIPMTDVALLVNATYSLGVGSSSSGESQFRFLISGTIYLPPSPEAIAKDGEDVVRPRLEAAIRYDGSWEFKAAAYNIAFSSLLSIFGDPSEQDEVRDILGHLLLAKLSFTYKYNKSEAVGLEFHASIIFKGYQLDLDYIRKSTAETDGKTSWTLNIVCKAEVTKEPLRLDVFLQWLLGSKTDLSSLPPFLLNTTFDLSKVDFQFCCKKDVSISNVSTLAISVGLSIGDVAVNIAQIRTTPAASTPGEKPKLSPVKTVIRVSLAGLPQPPPIPVIGPIEQQFALEFMYASSNMIADDLSAINATAGGFQKRALVAATDAGVEGVVSGKGCSFTLLAGNTPVVSSVPKIEPAAKQEVKEPVAGQPEVPAPTPSVPVTTPSSPSAVEKGPEMKPFAKKVNAISISSVGLDYKPKDKTLTILISATAQLGPLEVALTGFQMIIDFSKCNGTQPSEWSKLSLDVGLQGLAIGMTGPTMTIAGFLEQISEVSETRSTAGYIGGVSVIMTPYAFTAFGAYQEITDPSGKFESMFIYAMLQGPLLKTPFVELIGMSGGFGYGSQLTLPSAADVNKFPLLMQKDPDPMASFALLRSSPYISPARGSYWFAVGVSATALQCIDLSAVLTLQLSPEVTEIGIIGSATASLPRGQPPVKSLVVIEMGFVGKIDLTHGSFLFQGEIGSGSFILSDMCKPSGGFMVASWFGPSPHAGDWCMSIGGWHPAFVPPEHYPPPPPRLQIAWRVSDNLSFTGKAYAAITPDALMGGVALSALFSMGRLSAHLDASADFIIQLHPLFYSADIAVSAGVNYELRILWVTSKISVEVGATLHISGPPFSATAHFEVCIFSFDVAFGASPAPAPALTLPEFVEVLRQKGKDDKYYTDHVFTLQTGAVPQKTQAAGSEGQTPDKPWMVRAADLSFTISSRVVLSSATVVEGDSAPITHESPLLSRPMQMNTSSKGLRSDMTITITSTTSNTTVARFRSTPVRDNVPSSLWGPYDPNSAVMLAGSSRPVTVNLITGVSLQPPNATWSTVNPVKMALRDLTPPHVTTAEIKTDSLTDPAYDAQHRRRHGELELEKGSAQEADDFDRAQQALLSLASNTTLPQKPDVSGLNLRRTKILARWVGLRQREKAKNRTAQEKDKHAEKLLEKCKVMAQAPVRLAIGLERFCHTAPRISVVT